MRQYLIKKYIFTAFFLGMLFIFSGFNFLIHYNSLKETFQKTAQIQQLSEKIHMTETAMNENIYGKYIFMEGYGLIQKILNKKEINNFEVVKDRNGFLYGSNFNTKPYYAVKELAERVKRMQISAVGSGCQVIALMPPVKEINVASGYEKGFPKSYFTETADAYLSYLKQGNVPVIDFRKTEKMSQLSQSELFYKTDHHWTIQAAFTAFMDLTQVMDSTYGTDWDPKGYYSNPDNYNQLTYPNTFLGSYGRKAGIIYGGIDDFTLIYPKFTTNYEYYYEHGDKSELLSGSFEEALVYTNFLKSTDIYQNDKYMCYLEAVRSMDKITNTKNKSGSKVLLIRDSYMSPLAAFLSSVCSEVDMLYPLGYQKSIETYIEQNKHKYDYIYVSLYPENLTLEAFPFYETENGTTQ